MSSGIKKKCRQLTRADAVQLELLEPIRGSSFDLPKELAALGSYTWMGLFSNERLVAAHRSMNWGPYLLMKGLFVAPDYLGSTAGLQVAMALREYARDMNYRGVVAWVEPTKPEREIAARLRIRMRQPTVHRFGVSIPGCATARESRPLAPAYWGTLSPQWSGSPMVPDLLTSATEGNSIVHWVSDQNRIALSGNPCRSFEDLSILLSQISPVARSIGATTVELPFLAADVEGMLSAITLGAHRLSRSVVCLGAHSFQASLGGRRPFNADGSGVSREKRYVG